MSEKKFRDLGNGRGKRKIRPEAVPFPNPKCEKKSFSVWKRDKDGRT
jgi:hypothetical protein